MLEVDVDDAYHADVLALPRHSGLKAAGPAHDEAYLNAGAARLVEQVYHILVGEAVEFRLDVGLFAFLCVFAFFISSSTSFSKVCLML